jgi:hypothetical protein
MLVCAKCWKPDPGAIKGVNSSCRACGQKWALVEIDDLLTPTIIILNLKGYGTKYCCSGHVGHPYAYISFEQDKAPSIFPEGWHPEATGWGAIAIYISSPEQILDMSLEGMAAMYRALVTFSLNALAWAESLPNLKEQNGKVKS